MERVARVATIGSNDNRVFIAAETHRLGNWHVHGLVRLPHAAEWAFDYLKSDFNRLGYNRLEPIRKIEAVSTYCAKYLTKDRLGDWEMYGNWKVKDVLLTPRVTI